MCTYTHADIQYTEGTTTCTQYKFKQPNRKNKVLLHCTVPNHLKNENARLSDLVPSEENYLILVCIPLKTAFYELMMASTERKYADLTF